jgi:hypothetical protein
MSIFSALTKINPREPLVRFFSSAFPGGKNSLKRLFFSGLGLNVTPQLAHYKALKKKMTTTY